MQLLAEPIETALQPLQDRISSLESTIARLMEENAAMAATQAHFIENQEIQARLIRELKEKARKEPGKTELSRAEKIEKYLAARPDHKATFETLRGHLGIDKDLLNDAIKTLMSSSPGRYGIARATGDKRKRTLVMLPK
jgi:regulator of replication initiation timing